MRSPLIVATLGLFLLADVAQAQTVVQTSNIIVRAFGRTIDFTSDTTTSIRDSKVVREAHDDAATFVAAKATFVACSWNRLSAPCVTAYLKPAMPVIKTSPKPSSLCEAVNLLACSLWPAADRQQCPGRAAPATQDRRSESG